MFINTNNTIYVAASDLNQIVMLSSLNYTSVKRIGTGLMNPHGFFVTMNNDIYIDNGPNYSQVEKWTMNGTKIMVVMNTTLYCCHLFVDIGSTLYCSLDLQQIVMKTLLDPGINTTFTVAAGNGTMGSSSTLLHYPNGIFVDTELNLYVADCGKRQNTAFLAQSNKWNNRCRSYSTWNHNTYVPN